MIHSTSFFDENFFRFMYGVLGFIVGGICMSLAVWEHMSEIIKENSLLKEKLDQFELSLPKEFSVGTKLVAVSPCTMDFLGKESDSLIVGKDYEIIEDDDDMFAVATETSARHWFYKSDFETYFVHEQAEI